MNENSIYLRLIKYGIDHPEGFNYNKIKNDLNLEGLNAEILENYISNAFSNVTSSIYGGYPNLETVFLTSRITGGSDYKDDNRKYAINLDAHMKYIDYLELKEARKNSRIAFNCSLIAISIALISFIYQAFMPIKLNDKSINTNLEKIIDNQTQLINSKE